MHIAAEGPEERNKSAPRVMKQTGLLNVTQLLARASNRTRTMLEENTQELRTPCLVAKSQAVLLASVGPKAADLKFLL
ncbi:hypothetical protein GCM10007919_15740 [Rhizobium indigoferae]|nr:hypothetical protein GCM10007919_15740 [Rhizobium indigoferae]